MLPKIIVEKEKGKDSKLKFFFSLVMYANFKAKIRNLFYTYPNLIIFSFISYFVRILKYVND